MKIRTLVMVEPAAPGAHVYANISMPRLGLLILATLARRRGIEVRVHFGDGSPRLEHDLTQADAVCISTITPTAPNAYRLADRVRAANTPVLLGGPHVTFMPDEAIQHADWLLRGEAERSFPRWLDVVEDDGDPCDVPGLTHRHGGRVVHNPLDPVPTNMADVPTIDLHDLDRHSLAWRRMQFVPVQWSRGCPHRCNFCSVTPMFGRKMRYASNEQVAEQLERHRGRGRGVFFVDDNFAANPDRTMALLDHLLTTHTYLPPWLAQVSVRAARHTELLALMKRAGCSAICVGFESIEPEALALYRKRQSVDEIRHAVSRFHDAGLWVHGMFVVGSDAENVDTVRETARFVIQQDIESVQLMVLTPLPGTPLFDEMDGHGRLLTRNWALYDGHHTVFRPARMSARVLMTEAMKAMASVYSAGRIARQFIRGDIVRSFSGLHARWQIARWWHQSRSWRRATSGHMVDPGRLLPAVVPDSRPATIGG